MVSFLAVLNVLGLVYRCSVAEHTWFFTLPVTCEVHRSTLTLIGAVGASG